MVFRSLFNTFVPRNILYIIIMEITTYNADGTINETKHIDLQVPEYVKKYDEQNSFLNITAEEVEVVNSRKRTFRKTLLLRRLTAAIKHDYANFRDAYKMEADNLEVDVDVFMHEAESDPQIQSGDRIISSIMRIYGNRSQIRHTGVNISEQTFLEQTCTEEEFLIYINKVEHQMADENGNITSANWIKVIMYHAFKGAGIVRLKDGNVEEEARFYISLQNLINRYYYSLRNMERAAYWMPAELKHQMYVLSVFVKKADVKSVYRFEESRFFIKLINALYLMNEEQRSSLYKMADVVLGYNPTIGFNNQIFESLRNEEITKHEVKEYVVTLNDYNKIPYKRFKIDENEICTLRIPSSANQTITELQRWLNELNQHHEVAFRHKWATNIQTDSEIYFNKQKPYHEDWSGFYNNMIETYRTVSINSDDWHKPQLCFYLMLCNNVHPNKKLYFNTDIIIDLIDLLKKEKSDNDEVLYDSQVGLYECMFKINFVKGQIERRNPSDEAVSRAMKYLEPLFAPDCEYVIDKFRVKLRVLMQNLLNYQGIKPDMTTITPNGFTGGFNLQLVYNILGTLRTTVPVILTKGKDWIDDDLGSKAVQNGVIHKDDKRIRGHFMYEKCNVYNKYYNEMVYIIYSFINRITGDSE